MSALSHRLKNVLPQFKSEVSSIQADILATCEYLQAHAKKFLYALHAYLMVHHQTKPRMGYIMLVEASKTGLRTIINLKLKATKIIVYTFQTKPATW